MGLDGDAKMFTCEKVSHLHLQVRFHRMVEKSQKSWARSSQMAMRVVSRRG